MLAELIDKENGKSLYRRIVPVDEQSRIKIMRMCPTPACQYFLNTCVGMGNDSDARLTHILNKKEIEKFKKKAPCLNLKK